MKSLEARSDERESRQVLLSIAATTKALTVVAIAHRSYSIAEYSDVDCGLI